MYTLLLLPQPVNLCDEGPTVERLKQMEFPAHAYTSLRNERNLYTNASFREGDVFRTSRSLRTTNRRALRQSRMVST